MTVLHAFVDESYRQNYLLCAAIFDSRKVATARRGLVAMLQGGQGRLHMSKERDARRRALLEHIASMGQVAHIVTVDTLHRSLRTARDKCLKELTSQLVQLGVVRLVIESCDQDRRDMQVIGDELARLKALGALEVQHLHPHADPLLWVPDAIAWAYGKGGKVWGALVMPLISKVTEV